MKKYWSTVGIAVVAAAALYYPAMKLYKYLAAKKSEGNEEKENGTVTVKAFAPAYRGKHKPHHRHSHNGDMNSSQG